MTIAAVPPSTQTNVGGIKSEKTDGGPKKAYLIAHIDVSDPQRYALYQEVDYDAFARYGGRFIVRGGVQQPLVGQLKSRTIVIEFDTLQAARAFYHSDENQSAKSIRLSFASADAVIVEGCAED